MLGICCCNDTFFIVAILCITFYLFLIVSPTCSERIVLLSCLFPLIRILCLLSLGKSDSAGIKQQIFQQCSKSYSARNILKQFFKFLMFIPYCIIYNSDTELFVFPARMQSLGITNLENARIRQICSLWIPYFFHLFFLNSYNSLFAESFSVVLRNSAYASYPNFCNQTVENIFV